MSIYPGEAYYRILFGVLVRDHRKRRDAMDKAVAFIRSAEDKSVCIGPTLERLAATRSGTDGLDLAIELLYEIGEPVLDFTEAFLKADAKRWVGAGRLGIHVNNDVVYVLLRALGNAGLDRERTLEVMYCCLAYGNPTIRDAAVWALGDMGTPEALALVRSHGLIDCSAGVREASKLVLQEQEEI